MVNVVGNKYFTLLWIFSPEASLAIPGDAWIDVYVRMISCKTSSNICKGILDCGFIAWIDRQFTIKVSIIKQQKWLI